MDSIVTYLLIQNQYLLNIISELLLFISKYIPLKQMAFKDSNSPEYQKFKVDKLPKIIYFEKVDYQLLLAYYKYKLHYIYREFTLDFFKMDLHELPKCATNFKFKKFNAHVTGLVLTYHVNLKLSTRQTAQALRDIHGIHISHTTVASYALTAAAVIRPFVDTFDYKPSNNLVADETYIKVKGIRHFIWFIMDASKKSILGYQVSDTRSVGPCILARQQFQLKEHKTFDLTQVIGLTNEDAVSAEFRWFKQVIERLNRTFKTSYCVTCGYGSDNGAYYGVSLWVAYYNFLRPHQSYNYKSLNEVPMINQSDNMPAKWQLLIYLGQQAILKQQQNSV